MDLLSNTIFQDLENKNDVYADLVDTERIAEEENASLKRKLSQMQIELDHVQQKRRKRYFEKNSKTSEKSKASEKVKYSEKIPDQKMKLMHHLKYLKIFANM